MTLFLQFSPLRMLCQLIGRAWNALWDFNEMYWLNPLAAALSFSVIFHVMGALFPPLENSCWANSGTLLPVHSENERHQQ